MNVIDMYKHMSERAPSLLEIYKRGVSRGGDPDAFLAIAAHFVRLSTKEFVDIKNSEREDVVWPIAPFVRLAEVIEILEMMAGEEYVSLVAERFEKVEKNQ